MTEKERTIHEWVKFDFYWNNEWHKITLLEKDFNPQLDRFYAYFYIGDDYFWFEDSLDEDRQPIIEQPGVWHSVNENEEEYFNDRHRNLAWK